MRRTMKLTEAENYKRYKVSFYVDTADMNNMDIEEKVDELLKGSGLASSDESIDVELVDSLDEAITHGVNLNEPEK